MQYINALALTCHVNTWLAHSGHPTVLHLFDHACNLINERREVLSIVTQDIGNGPFNLVIPGFRKRRRGPAMRGMATSFERLPSGDASRQTSEAFATLNLQSPVSNFLHHLTLGDLTICTAESILWNPSPDWEMLHAKRDDISNQLTQLQIIAKRPCGTNYLKYAGLDTGFATNAQPYSTTGVLQFSNSLVSNLPIALVKRDIASAKEITSKLAGLGAGLTPAGDDFILGAIYATWMIHPPEIARVLAEEITNIAAPLTTSLSAAWLKAAGRGEAGNLWHEFFDALISDNLVQIHQTMDKILAVGETSGADGLAGFLGTLVSWMAEAKA